MTGQTATPYSGLSRSGLPSSLAAPLPPTAEGIEEQLRRLLASRTLSRSKELCRFLRFVVEQTLRNRTVRLKEYLIGIAVFDRGDGFNPATDPIVRVQARRLRAKLAQYYESEGRGDAVCIELPSGRYVPHFSYRDVTGITAPATPASFVPVPDISLGHATPRSVAVMGTHGEAHEFCRRARFLQQQATGESIRQSIVCFDRATQIDPGWAPAYAGLAVSYASRALLGLLPADAARSGAKNFAGTALDLDPRCAEPYAATALLRAVHEWDFAGAEKQFRKALDLAPSLALAHDWYALTTLIPMGHMEHAVLELKVALEFVPASVGIQSNLAWALFLSRRFDEAFEHCQYALASAPGDYRAHFVLGSIQESRSNFDIALSSYERAARLCGEEPPPFLTGAVGHAASKAGKITQAFDLLGRLASQREQGQVAVAAATILLGMGDMEAAFEWLETAAAQRECGLIWLTADPRFELLKNDGRFVTLARRLRLP